MIKDRCYNEKSINYQHYGGRGITICDEWINDFKAFHEHMMSLPHALEEGYTIDRKINLLGYKPGNMRWATWDEQNNNRRARSVPYPPMPESTKLKLIEANKKPVWRITPTGAVIKYGSILEAEVESGVSRTSIDRSIHNENPTRNGNTFGFI